MRPDDCAHFPIIRQGRFVCRDCHCRCELTVLGPTWTPPLTLAERGRMGGLISQPK